MEEYKKKSEVAESKRKEKEGALGVFQEACWNQSKTLRPTFDAAIKGKKTKALFAGEILKITPVHHDGSALVESGWGIDYKHDAVLGLCYMGAAYMSQHYERTVETAVLGATYVGNSYLANTF